MYQSIYLIAYMEKEIQLPMNWEINLIHPKYHFDLDNPVNQLDLEIPVDPDYLDHPVDPDYLDHLEDQLKQVNNLVHIYKVIL